MDWNTALSTDALPDGSRRVVTIAGREILLINKGGVIHAVGNRCPHLQAKMENAEVTDMGAIICPRHRSAFDLVTGMVEDWAPWPPVVRHALAAISPPKSLPVYPTKIDNGVIWVALDEAA